MPRNGEIWIVMQTSRARINVNCKMISNRIVFFMWCIQYRCKAKFIGGGGAKIQFFKEVEKLLPTKKFCNFKPLKQP